ncbi:MAG: hypothetical protein IT529_15320 [Burkholderiales bacterium]|nr:hypothetical protein [Burkholderiales bacterium]
MTIIAGALALTEDGGITSALKDHLRKAISRAPARVEEFEDRHAFLAKVDIGAFGVPAMRRDDAGNVSLLAGEPLLRPAREDGAPDRAADLATLHGQWVRSDWTGLARCAGTFCAVHRPAGERALVLVADKFGVRPIYYWTDGRSAVFATALRILEAIPSIPLAMDVRGTTEIAAFGLPLGERTAYAGVSTIGAGQIVRLAAGGVRKSEYWRWDRVAPRKDETPGLAAEVHRLFMSSVKRRLAGARSALAFLSGGLDSRVIVAALRAFGAAVHTINYALPGSQDHEFAAGAGRALDTHHHWLNPDLSGMYEFRGRIYNQGVVRRWLEEAPEAQGLPRVIWSGDGGSVGLGHVYLNPEIVELARSGNAEGAIERFLVRNRFSIHPRVLQPAMMGELMEMPRAGMREELARLECGDRGRAMHLFLMLNDQRRHMANHFESIDLERIEFHMPFFDADFLEPVLANPVEPFLLHRFYMEWLGHFGPAVLSVPWQAYPGHVPCPLPPPPGLRYQWSNLFPENITRKFDRDLVREVERLIALPSFPDNILRRHMLRMAGWATRLGIRNCDYLLKMAAVYCRYAAGGARADGR